eukprot:jgi/Tetstr1/431703/TSEL_021228.t1
MKSAEELLLSTEEERYRREHYRMLIDNFTARRIALEAQFDVVILKCEEASRIPEGAIGKAEAPSASSRRSKRARRMAEDDDSDSDDDEFGSASKLLPRELPQPP